MFETTFYEFDTIFREYFDDQYVFYLSGGANSHMNPNGAMLFDAFYIGPMLEKEMGWKFYYQINN